MYVYVPVSTRELGSTIVVVSVVVFEGLVTGWLGTN